MNTNKDLSTRERILHLMKTAGPLSAKELTTELQITEMAVRRHLGTMERDGLIESKMIRQTQGRPTAVYGLTELAEGIFPKNIIRSPWTCWMNWPRKAAKEWWIAYLTGARRS